MGLLLRSFIKIEGSFLKRSFDKSANAPHEAQKKYLLTILRKNKNTEYGQKYHFSSINSEKELRQHVPINSYQDLRPYIDKIISGHKNILTADNPVLFNLTSGTSDKPKYIPVTARTKKRTDSLTHQWMYRTLLDHPSFLDKANFSITSSAIEGYTPSGIPYGSLSGLIYKNLPCVVRRTYVLPYKVTEIKNYDLRYYAMARLALEKEISFIATPNPTTLTKVADIGIRHQEEIIRSIRDGRLFTNLDFQINAADSKILKALNRSLRPNRSRTRFLSNVIKTNNSLLPYCCWPSLKLIGCWLGGSIGYHAEKLSTYYGNIPRRDIGYLASEGCFTLPYDDSTPAGILALQNNYYEFIPKEQAAHSRPEVLKAHELEIGQHYKVLLTNESGLYRYDINDIVKVDSFYKLTPVLAFVRKTSDILNITGEKLHINQLFLAFQKIKSGFNIAITQFRVVSNQKKLRYEIFMGLRQDISLELLRNSVLPAIDSCLSEINIEYAQKRKSKRLNPPCLHIMAPSWEENVRKEAVESGKRDVQYKWRHIWPELLEIDQRYITNTVNYKE